MASTLTSPWNSLEVAKISIGIITPISIAFLGISVTMGAEKRTAEREEAVRIETLKRENSSSKAARTREVEFRRQAEAREQLLQRQAFKRERELAQEAFVRESNTRINAMAREDGLRLQAQLRDDATRRQQILLSRYERIIAVQTQAWNQISSDLEQLVDISTVKGSLTNDQISIFNSKISVVKAVISRQRAYLSSDFLGAFDNIIYSIDYRLGVTTPPDDPRPDGKDMAIEAQYHRLFQIVRRALVLGNLAPSTCGDTDLDCQLRDMFDDKPLPN